MIAWADFLDSRVRIIHEMDDDGLPLDEIVARLSVDAEQVALSALTPTEPPIPGSSRDQLVSWKKRAEDLERELHGPGTAEAPKPAQPAHRRDTSFVRALLCDDDPNKCGCQYWVEQPGQLSTAPGQHHAECPYAPEKP